MHSKIFLGIYYCQEAPLPKIFINKISWYTTFINYVDKGGARWVEEGDRAVIRQDRSITQESTKKNGLL